MEQIVEELVKFVRILLPVLFVAAIVSACTNEPPVGAAPGTFTPTIDSSGAVDVSAQMAAFLAAVPDGSVISLRPGGRYRMEQTLVIDGRRGLTIWGNGASFVFTTPGDRSTADNARRTRARANLRIVNSADITVSGLNVIGANPEAGMGDAAYRPEYEAQHGFDIRYSTRISLLGCSATDTYGDFVYIGGQYGGSTRSTDILVRSFTGLRSGRMGIAMTRASRVVVEQSTLSQVRRSTFDLEPEGDAASVDNVTLRNNRIMGGRLNFVAAHGKGPIDQITVQGNRLSGQALSVTVFDIDGGRRSGWQVLDNSSDYGAGNPSLAVMSFTRVDGVLVRGNRQLMSLRGGAGGPQPLMYLVRTSDTTGVVVDGNTVLQGAGELQPG